LASEVEIAIVMLQMQMQMQVEKSIVKLDLVVETLCLNLIAIVNSSAVACLAVVDFAVAVADTCDLSTIWIVCD
jgi:hypothetical protein